MFAVFVTRGTSPGRLHLLLSIYLPLIIFL